MTLLIGYKKGKKRYLSADRRVSSNAEVAYDYCKVVEGKNFLMASTGFTAQCMAVAEFVKDKELKDDHLGVLDLRKLMIEFLAEMKMDTDHKSPKDWFPDSLITTKNNIRLLTDDGGVYRYDEYAYGCGEDMAQALLKMKKPIKKIFEEVNKKYPSAVSREFDTKSI